jgi:FixJ family two-component response regulator
MSHTLVPSVSVVDADASVRESLEDLVQSAGWRAEIFASAGEFLSSPRAAAPCCLIVEANLPGVSGLELQRLLAVERSEMPIIFLSGQCDVETTVKAMKAGAFDFLTKPVDEQALLQVIGNALRRSEATLRRETELRQLREGYGSLTPREREVMTLVASGLPNKQVGGELGISEITVKAHRGNVMRKMNAGSLAHLVSMALRLRIMRPMTVSPAAA